MTSLIEQTSAKPRSGPSAEYLTLDVRDMSGQKTTGPGEREREPAE